MQSQFWGRKENRVLLARLLGLQFLGLPAAGHSNFADFHVPPKYRRAEVFPWFLLTWHASTVSCIIVQPRVKVESESYAATHAVKGQGRRRDTVTFKESTIREP